MAPQPPQNTPQERQDALAAALRARQDRASVKQTITDGSRTVADVLAAGHRGQGDPIEGRIRIGDLILAPAGIGPVKAAAILAAAGITDAEEHVDQLSAEQVKALEEALQQHGVQ